MELESLTIDGVRAAVADGSMTAATVAERHYGLIEAEDGAKGKADQ